jgi:DNA-binding NarL/FixJ family response regulator
MVDRFDTDGRRFVVAIKNDPVYRDPRGLTERERQVAEFVGLGRSSTEVAYTLGISEAAVTNCTARAQEKLGLASRAELVADFAQNGLRRKLAEAAVAGERLLIGAYPLVDERCVATLSDAERDVVAHLVAGSTNGDIARRRGTSEHTVANQVQSIFRKLRVRARGELVARLQAKNQDVGES